MAPKLDRPRCYEARDKFFQCIDQFKKDDEIVKNCMNLKDEFEKACPPSWVHHFVLQRQTTAGSNASIPGLDIMEEETVFVQEDPVFPGDGSNDTVVVPATPEDVDCVTLEDPSKAEDDELENQPPTTASTDNIRKSGRARKPKKIPEAAPPDEEEKPKRKYTKRKSVVGTDQPVETQTELPPKKKTRRKSVVAAEQEPVVGVQAPLVSAPIIESADADAPPIMITAESFVLPPEPKQPKKKKEKFVPADVPPIAGLPRRYDPHAKKARKVKKPEENNAATAEEKNDEKTDEKVVQDESIIDSRDEVLVDAPMVETGPQDADAPPPAPYDPSMDAVPLPIEVVEKPQSTTPAPKKLTPLEMAMKNQPSVLKFFTSKQQSEASPEDREASRSPMRDIPVRPATPGSPVQADSVARPAPERAEFSLYLEAWKELKKTTRRRPSVRQFFSRSDGGTNLRYLGVSEIAPKKTTVYAGENPVHRLRLKRVRPVYIAIHDRERPPVRMIIAHASTGVSGRHPLATDPIIDYERDSDEEWAEENDGEDLNSNADEDEEEEGETGVGATGEGQDDDDAQSENSFFVSDGHFSEDEALSDDEAMVARRRRNEMSVDSEGKSTLQLIVFSPADLETQDTDYSNEPNHAKWFNLLYNEACVKVYDESHYFAEPVVQVVEKIKPVKVEKPPKPEKPTVDRSELARFVHGKIVNIDSLIADFKGLYPDLSANALKTEIRSIASWTKKPDLIQRIAWFVKPELFGDLGLTEEEMGMLIAERKAAIPVAPATVKAAPVAPASANSANVLPFKPVDVEPSGDAEQRANIHN